MTTTEFDLSELENPAADPNLGKAQKLAEAKAAIAGTTPLIPDAPDCIVRLPRGLFINGEWKAEVEVRELNGADEEALARTKESSDFYDLVLAHGVIRVDNEDLAVLPVSERQALLRTLLLGERSQLLLAILVVTYGNEKALTLTCPHCNLDQELKLLLQDDFKPKEVADVTKPVFEFVTKNRDLIEYRLVTGADQAEVLKRKGTTTAEQNSVILSRCITKVNGQLVVNPMAYVRDMGMRDRNSLLSEMVDRQPDLDMNVQTVCMGCGGDVLFALGWGDLFRP